MERIESKAVLECRMISIKRILRALRSKTPGYPATVGNLFLCIRRSLSIDARLNQKQ